MKFFERFLKRKFFCGQPSDRGNVDKTTYNHREALSAKDFAVIAKGRGRYIA